MKTKRRPAGLATRLLVVCLGLYLTIAALATFLEVFQVTEQADRTSRAEIASLAKTFGPPLQSALWGYDENQVGVLLHVLAEVPSVGWVKITTTEGRVFEDPTRKPVPPEALGPAQVFSLSHEKGGRFVYVGSLKMQPLRAAVQDQVTATIGRAASRTALVVVMLSLVLVFVARRLVGRPLRNLALKISAIDPRVPGAGTLAIDTEAGVELGLVTEAFNRLLAELLAANASLESKVATRTLHLEQTIQELSSTRDKLVDSAKMAVLGQLVAGVAHDLNTPLGAALSASNSALALLEELRGDWASGPEAMALFGRAADSVSLVLGHRDSKARRQLAREVAEAGIEPAGPTVELLDEMGVTPPLGTLGPLLATASGQEALVKVHRFTVLARSCRVMALASEKMAAVVDNLLRYSRKEDETAFQPADLGAQLETILVLFAAAIKGGVSVTRKFEDVPPVLCRADRIQQVWINLVGNAIQAMGGAGNLELGIHRTPGGVEVSVANDGPPIPPETAARLFTPFFTTKPRGSGTGLGLSICQRIVEEHGGRIDFETGVGRTVFTVRLPARLVSSPSAS